MAQKVTESVKGMDQGMETVAEVCLERAGAEVGKGLEGSAFKSSVNGGEADVTKADEKVGGRHSVLPAILSIRTMQRTLILWISMTWIPAS